MSDGPDGGVESKSGSGSGAGAGSGGGEAKDAGAGDVSGAPSSSSASGGAGSAAGSASGGAGAGTGSGSGSGSGDPTNVAAGRGSGSGSGSGTNAVATPITVTLKVQCGHTASGIREMDGVTGAPARLQIVPSTGQVTGTNTISCMAGQLKISVTENTGGTDALQATMIISGGSGSGGGSGSASGAAAPQMAITQNNPPADSDWQSVTTLTQSIPTPDSNGYLLMDVQPTLWQVCARGHPDDLPVGVQVEAYPAYSVSGSISDDFFKTVSQGINDSIKTVLQVMEQLPIQVAPQIQLPAGTLSITCGWQENSDWTAYYGLSINAQINPLLGVGVQFSVNALALAGVMIDVPPSLTKYLGAIVLSFTISGQISVNGSVSFKGPNMSGSLGPGGEIDLTVAGQATAGNAQVASADVKVSATGGIKWSGTLDPPSSGGLVLHQTLSLTGLVGSFSVSLTAFGVGPTTGDSVTLWPAGNPAQLPDWQLIDPSSS